MNPKELKKLNNGKIKTILLCIICFIAWIIFYYLAGFSGLIPDKFYTQVMIVSSTLLLIVLPIFLCFNFLSGIQKNLVPYVLSNFPDWKLAIPRQFTKRRGPWNAEILPPQEFVFSSILPGYNAMFHLTDAFSSEDTLKSISQIQYAEISKRVDKKPIYISTLINVKTSKDLQSTTHFKTNNYPQKTNKDIIQEKHKIELPKIELSNAKENNIDVYSDNQTIAEKLATPELFSAMQNIKEQLNLPYVEAIFHDDKIIFVLRHKGYNMLDYQGFFIHIPLFKSIDYPLIEQAINNFKTLTDLANQAPKFTENV